MGEIGKLSAEELAELRKQIKVVAKEVERNEKTDDISATAEGVDGQKVTEDALLKRIVVRIAEDKMSATVLLTDPGEDETYTVPEIVGELRKNKVLSGIKSSIIAKMIEDKQYDEHIEVAKGNPVEPAQEGYYEFLFKTEEVKKPEIREDGTADYAAVGRLQNVEAGQVIAIYHPAKQGKNGFNVNGMEIIAKIARDLPVLRGQYIARNDDTGEYTAKISGKISLKEYNIEILDVHEINDDVTSLQGKVEFYGDLYIKGDVENGVIIRAGRNVVINGTVGAASIYAGGDIILSKGIQGAGRGKVSARGNVFSDFIEYARVDSGMDIYANSIINSDIYTQGNVVVSGKHGSIIGGNAHGLRGITANAAGSVNEARTSLHAGFPAEYYQKFSDFAKLQKKKNNELGEVVEEITQLLRIRSKNGGQFNREQRLSAMALKEKKESICAELEQIKLDMEDIGRSMSKSAGASITIRGNVYRNVMIGVDAAQICITRDESYVRYICKNNEIERRTVPVGTV